MCLHAEGFPGGSDGKASACNAGDPGSILGWEDPLEKEMATHSSTLWEIQVQSWVGKIPWRRKWQPTPVLLPGQFHGQMSLVGYSPWGCKESGTTE